MYIGRLRNVGFGKEAVRGTVIIPSIWTPVMEATFDDKIVQAINESSLGVIADADNASVVKKFSEGELTGKLNNDSIGLILNSTFGDNTAPALVSGEVAVYDHTFIMTQSAKHPSLTLTIENPVETLSYPLCMVESLEIVAELEKYVTYTLGVRANVGATSAYTPSYVSEHFFLPQDCEVTFYPDWADLVADTNGDVYNFRRLSLTISKNLEDSQTLGNVSATERLNKQFVIEGSLEILHETTDFKDLLLGDTMKALKIKMVDTATTLGVASNPEFEIDLAKVKVNEIAKDQANNDLVKETITFKAFYSLADDVMIETRLRNLANTSY